MDESATRASQIVGLGARTMAAAAGGITTVCDMPLNCHPPTLDGRALAFKRSAVADHALIDYALWGGLVPESVDHAGELQREGVVGVKAFLCDSGLAEYRHLDEFSQLEAMQVCADLGLLLGLLLHRGEASTKVLNMLRQLLKLLLQIANVTLDALRDLRRTTIGITLLLLTGRSLLLPLRGGCDDLAPIKAH